MCLYAQLWVAAGLLGWDEILHPAKILRWLLWMWRLVTTHSQVVVKAHHPFLVVSGNGEWEWWLLNSWAPPPFTHPFWVLQCWLTAAPIFSVGIGLLTPQRSASTSTMKCNVECWHTRTLDTPDGDGWWQWQDFCCLDLGFLVVCCML